MHSPTIIVWGLLYSYTYGVEPAICTCLLQVKLLPPSPAQQANPPSLLTDAPPPLRLQASQLEVAKLSLARELAEARQALQDLGAAQDGLRAQVCEGVMAAMVVRLGAA
jgi:hypothetical protein